MKVVTFFIPCYNVESCVSRCLDSILHPEILDQIEILAINDGSKDNTLSLLRNYECRYPQTIKVIDKTNGGWGTAVNLGLNKASGKYFKEVDADDWVSTENLTEYVKFLQSNDVDYIATEYTEYFSKENEYHPHTFQKPIYNHTISLNEFWDNYPTAWDFPIHAITYKTSFIREQVNLKVGDRYYGDFEYFTYPQPYIGSIYVLPINITVYFRGSDDQSTSTRGYSKNYRDMAALSLRLSSFYDNLPNNLHPRLKKHICNGVEGTIRLSYEIMMSPVYAGKKDGVKEYLKEYNKQLKITSPFFFKRSNHFKKKSIPYIWIWRKLKINILATRG